MALATSGISWWLSLSLGSHIVWLGFYIVVFDTSCVMFHHVASHVLVGGGFSGCGVGLRSRGGRDDRHAFRPGSGLHSVILHGFVCADAGVGLGASSFPVSCAGTMRGVVCQPVGGVKGH